MLNNIFAFLQPLALIQTLGIAGIFFVIFAESGLFFGFFFPGESLLFVAGFLASQNLLNIYAVLIGVFISAVLGDSVGYWFGRKVGNRIFNGNDSFFLKKKHIQTTKNFYDKHGNKTVFIARFVPIVRTFAPILAGVAEMKYKDFIRYNIAGAFIWSFIMTLIGYFLGKAVPNAEHYLVPIVLGIIFLSFLPVIFEFFRSKKKII
jgi:membrane-associated protein